MVPNNITSKLLETVKFQGILITITLLLTTTMNVFSQETEKLTIVPFKEIIIKGYAPKKDGGYVIKDHYEYIKTFDPTLRVGAFSEYKLPEIDFRRYFLLGVKFSLMGLEEPKINIRVLRDEGYETVVEVDIIEIDGSSCPWTATKWVLIKRKYWEEDVDFYVNKSRMQADKE
ncbi:hypothetical protein EYV94_21135 [Puteibacter caeruleilacunae]|nr:hypothetical protein EYV94_21135 [Puteibacter caeruleilacunae]